MSHPLSAAPSAAIAATNSQRMTRSQDCAYPRAAAPRLGLGFRV